MEKGRGGKWEFLVTNNTRQRVINSRIKGLSLMGVKQGRWHSRVLILQVQALRSIASTHAKKMDMTVHTGNLSSGEAERGGSHGLPSPATLSYLDSPQPVKYSVSQTRWIMLEDQNLTLSSSLQLYVSTSTCTLMHTYWTCTCTHRANVKVDLHHHQCYQKPAEEHAW